MALTSMNISLSEDLMRFAAADMKEHGYASISEYLRALVREQRNQIRERQLLALVNAARPQKAVRKRIRGIKG